MQRPFKREIIPEIVPLLFFGALNACNLNKLYYISLTLGTQPFSSVLPRDKLARDLAVTFALFIPEPRQNSSGFHGAHSIF